MTTDSTDLLERIASTDPVDSTETAREGVEATMETLGERITDGQAEDLAATLLDVAAEPLREAHPREAEEFSLATFVARVAERTPVTDDAGDPIEPVDLIRAVLTGVGTAADDAELERTRDQLRDEFGVVFEPGRLLDAEEFHETVAERLLDGVDADPRTATDATLRTLADRITGRQAVDLALYLPRAVRRPLIDTDEDVREFGREEFLEHVATRANVAESDAADLARAVFDATP
ncbi:DUF2267 domain-containing protein [Natronococcus wangiae]|uniref:DUF2267 domain-containing protein n=1 Tax=Natronococcus wangiae TaxID=3068275 RepID=UPI00273D0054|nr:DUF2267 domain-containing protein [Natronococcus sp. AD5]